MKLKKRTFIIFFLIIILVFTWYFWNKSKQVKIEAEKKAKMAYTVKVWDIKTEVKVTATANLADEQNLSFWKEWKITNVFVKIWDEIKAWNVLAELNMDDYQNSIQTLRLELQNSQLLLQKLINSDTSLRESQISSQINEANSNYDIELKQEKILKQQLEIIIQYKKEELEQLARDYILSEKNLEILKSELDVTTILETEETQSTLIARTQTINSIINSLDSSLWDIELIIESIDKIFWVSNDFKDENNDYEDYLWVKDIALKNLTESNIRDSYSFINKYIIEFENISIEMSDSEIYTIIQNFYIDSKILVELCNIALDSIDMSIESVNNLSSSMIEWFKNIVSTSRINTISVRSNLEILSTSINSLLSSSLQEDQLKVLIEQKELNYERQEILLKNKQENILLFASDLKNLEKDHENQLKRKQSQIIIILEGINLLKKELQDLLDWPDFYDIEQQKNLIRQSELRLERALDQKDDYQIIAEFDWRVRSVDIIEWEQYKLDDRTFIVLENPNLIELELQVNQIDIVKINENDPVIITFDAYSNNPISANITSINVNPEPNERWGIFYKANILLEKQELKILAGMSALVIITTNKAEGVILIPSLALIHEADKQFVYIKNGETYLRHEIKTWIVNNFQAEVIEWLKAGDIIRSSVLDEDALKEMWIDEWSANIFGN